MRFKNHWVVRYGLALAAVGAAFVARLALTSLTGPGLPAYITFYPAVMLAALLLGFGPGMVATISSALVCCAWVLAPTRELAVASLVDAVGLALFSGIGVCMSVVAELYRRARERTPPLVEEAKELPQRKEAEPPASTQGLLLNAGLLVSVAMLAVAGWQAFQDVQATRDATQRETHAHITLQQLDQLLSAMQEVQSAQRGFVLTGEESYVEPYQNAVAQVSTNLAVLKELTKDDPRQQEHLSALAPLVQEKFAELEQTIQARRHEGFQAALGLLTTAKSKGLMERIRKRVAKAQEEETGMLQVHTNAEAVSTNRTLQILLAGGTLSLLLLAAVFLFLKQENRRRIRAETALLRHQSRLREEVAARTAELGQINQNLEKLVAGRTAEVRATARYARSLIEASLDPLVTISREGKITDVNKATELVTGVARDRLIGSDFSKYFTAPEQARRGYRQVLSEGLLRDFPLTIRHASGRTVEVLYNATVYRNEAGEVQGVFAAARDITERQRMNNVLQESEARYRSLVTATAQIVWTTNLRGEVMKELPTWQAFTGQSLEQSEGLGWSHALHPEDREGTMASWSRALATRHLYETEYRLRRHDGQYRYVAARGVPVLDGEGNIREWVGTCTDITERKEAERRRELTNALLALFAHTGSVKEYLASVVEVVRQWSGCEALGLRILDEKQDLPFAAAAGFEPAFLEAEAGLSPAEGKCSGTQALTQTSEARAQFPVTPGGSYQCDNLPVFLTQIPPEKRPRYYDYCLKFGFTSIAVVPIRYRQQAIGDLHLADRRPNQFPLGTIEFLESMAPLVGEAVHRFQAESELAKYRDHLEELVKQRTLELVISNTRLESEIVERKRTEVTLHQTAQELQRSNRDLEQFAYVASHDLQEPLRAVAGYVKLLQRRFPAQIDAKALEYINGAVDGAARMERLITDLLAFARVGTRARALAPADLGELLGDALQNLRSSLRSTGAQVTSDALPELAVDATQFVQLFQNLIGNALKFRSLDRPPRVHIGSRKQDERWVLSVGDNGIGIDPQYFDRIFQIFQRLHTRKHYPGTGIGLAICKKIVERHGGAIWVESTPGAGSTFHLSLPETPAIKEPQYE